MKMQQRIHHGLCAVLVLLLLHPSIAISQTDFDADMMAKNNLCIGPMYGYSSWKNYWEGTFKRDNENLGRVSTQMISVVGTYGITGKLNVIASLPYVITHASEGPLHGLDGIQDLSLWIKWKTLSQQLGKGKFSLFALAGLSVPASNYTPDFQPFSIGLHSTTVSGRVIADYAIKKFFVTGSATYSYRDNVKIDRDAYYTTDLHLTNEVEMPNVASFNFRTGYRSRYLVAEAFVWNMTTLGGFDIRKNDMPFVSNRMNATSIGAAVKYKFRKLSQLTVTADASYVVAGRNVGQSTSVGGGVFYAFNFSKKAKTN